MEPVSPLREILLDQKEEKAAAGESSLLSIVQSQRDRLRQQNRELEEVSVKVLTAPGLGLWIF